MSGSDRRPTVLVAEDDALIRLDLREMLVEEGYDVLEAADGAQAVALARKHRPDLVILDVKMPVMDGIQAAEVIGGARIAPVLILSAYSQRELVERASQAGAMAYLLKPFQKQDLFPAIEIARHRFRQLVALADEVGDLAGQLEARKLVERAKGYLMDRFALREADAFRLIQQAAMRRRVPMESVARGIIDGESLPEETGPQE